MEHKIVCAGFGGQGILSLGKFMVYAGMDMGYEVTWLPSYGPEMRGGTANCSVVISDKPVASPLITHPNIVIAMNKPSLDKFVNVMSEKGIIFINSGLINDKVTRKDVTAYYLDANALATAADSERSANIVMLGAFVKVVKEFDKAMVIKALEHQFEGKKSLTGVLKAFEAGYNAV